MNAPQTKIAAIIPARMASVRFPGKMLFPFCDVPMVEHVRRRALLCPALSEVAVATCDEEIADVVESHGGRIIMTSPSHPTGMDRVAEAIHHVDCTHAIVLQGDEPLVLPEHLAALTSAIGDRPDIRAWNAIGPVEDDADLDNPSIVKCVVSHSGRIMLCSRRSPCLSNPSEQSNFIRKVLGLIAFQRDFLIELSDLPGTPFEIAESIEQSRILEHDVPLHSVELPASYPSVNEPSEAAQVQECLQRDPAQQAVLSKILES